MTPRGTGLAFRPEDGSPESRTEGFGRIVGTEVEYGISLESGEMGEAQIELSHELVNKLPSGFSSGALWDYEDEDPFVDARGFLVEGERERPDRRENRWTNRPLYNGGRLYVDGAHPEYSGPECMNLRDVVRFEKAGDRLVEECLKAWESDDPKKRSLRIFRNNSDGWGNSWGYHENYLLSRELPFDRIIQGLTAHLVSRTVFCGSGKVGSDLGEDRGLGAEIPYQISQRSEFFEIPVGLSTTARRGIINTRDEPHASRGIYRRLHVISGDSNLSEISTALKVGTTLLVLWVMEESHKEGADLSFPVLADPVSAFHQVSRDLTFRKPLPMADGSTTTVLDLAGSYLSTVRSWFERAGMNSEVRDLLDRWEGVLVRLGRYPDTSSGLEREVDWAIKRSMIWKYREARGLSGSDSRLRMLDLQYHDVRTSRGLFHLLDAGGQVDRFLDPMEIDDARLNPPSDTRAFFRGTLQRRFPKEVVAASWSSVVVDDGGTALKRIPLADPFRGTQKTVGAMLDRSETVQKLLDELRSKGGSSEKSEGVK